ncbi:RagB/SusD family nutrient uptake outer membrane protein [Pedobacter metabolipauper]|uniref:Putative outer membrane starch-binding protein n=1 Tax=Pedobacter metabolipauper TaxID=425513 RepID=A0A4R6SS15_9SPHI|nr:RagB/SusD family nutrient uptake outer membrane protein [Pedobacter metabolipauper]TDQ07341.1 putative outer membrane starch-binding protein [Pedobacter metabolipauper]
MKFSIKIFIGIVGLMGLFTSCKKYLDVTPDNVATIDYAFRNRNEAENYLFTCYSTLQRMNSAISDPAFTASGEVFFPNTLTEPTLGSREAEQGFHLIRGTQTTDRPALNYWDGEQMGQPLFLAIRRCNIFLENIDKPKDLPQFEKNRWIAEVKFLKAYYHYYLLRMYGPIPLIKDNLSIDAGTEQVRVKREPVDAAFDYIVSLLDEATPNLPTIIQDPAQSLGRITQLIALSVKAEVLTTQASPFFNGNTDYAGFKDKDGVNLFPTAYSSEKWLKAMQACEIAVKACETNNHTLYKFIAPGNLPTLPAELKTVMDIRQSITENWEVNPEVIWALNSTFDYQSMSMPRLTSAMVQNMGGAPGNFAVPIVMAELFYSKNGVPINEDRTYDYRGRYGVETVPAEEKYHLKQGYQTIKMHMGREPRFYADLAFDGSNYFGNGQTTPENMLFVQARGGTSIAGPKDNIRVNVSGYWPQKLVKYQSVFGVEVTQAAFRMPLIRLSGLYLMYAETLNEVNGPTADAYRYIDLVRARAGLKGVQESWTASSSNPGKVNSKEGLRQIIQQERRIELCFEGRIGWDLRRWKIMQQVLSTPLQGWSIQETSPEGYYRQRTMVVPVFGLKDYLWPIKYDDLIINPNLVQNPYW